MSSCENKTNKKVLLHEWKRHTARHVAALSPDLVTGGEVGGGDPSSPDRGIAPSSPNEGVPPSSLDRGLGGIPHQPDGTPLSGRMGVPPPPPIGKGVHPPPS